MDELEKKEFVEGYEDALNNTPETVRAFLWSDAYKGLVDGIAKFCKLTDVQKNVTSDVLFDLIIDLIDEDDSRIKLTAVGISEDTQGTIFRLAYEYLIDPAMQLTETELREDAEDEDGYIEPSTPQIVKPSEIKYSSNSLINIQNRLQTASIVAPVKTDYNADTTPAPASPTETPRPAIDPYHESIDNV